MSTLQELINTNRGTQDVLNFLSKPENINNCIIFSNLGLPVVSGIAKPLEDLFANDPDFPLSSKTNRQHVGRMISSIMKDYGYSPRVATVPERTLRNFSNASHFKTASIYNKNHTPYKKIEVTSSIII